MGDWILRAVKGAIIGVGAILPGISGGVLSVVLGIYRPVMAFLAHPISSFKRNAAYLLPVLLGAVVGIVLLSRVVDWLFRTSPTPAVWLFIGLVAGTLPSLYREAGLKGRPAGAWVALVLGALAMGGWMLFLACGGARHVTPNVWWWLLCGVLWGLSLVVPGLSSSSLFIFLGLYQPMTAAIGSLDFSVLLPLGAGLLLTIALLARGMNALLRSHYPYAMHAIIGIVVASTIAILPIADSIANGQYPLYVVCFVLGAGIALGMDWLSHRAKPETDT